MDIAKFQEKLTEICALGEANGKTLTPLQVRECFSGMELDKAQLLKIIQYLKLKGISIEGLELNSDNKETSAETPEVKKIPLTSEEEAYVKEYFEELNLTESGLRLHYLEAAARMAIEMNCEEIHIADLIQEANLSLLMVLEEAKAENREESWVLAQIRAGIIRAVEEQTQRKFEDDYLVAKVQNLESAIKELTEDEDGEETKFSVEELSIILDMSVDEIRDVLRLTGDDK